MKLVFQAADSGRPELLDLVDPRVEVWRDNEGAVCAYGYTLNGKHWMHFPGLAGFSFSNRGWKVTAIAQPSVSPGLVNDTCYRNVLPLALQVKGTEVLHASGVLTPQGVVAFCARCGAGKSTLAYGLSQRGYPLWADDAVAFKNSGPLIQTLPLPFGMRLLPDAALFFGVRRDSIYAEGALTVGDQVALPTDEEPQPLLALMELERFPEPGDSEAVEVLRLSPARAFPVALAHAYCFSLRDLARKRLMMRQYLDLTARVPVFKLRFPAGLKNLPLILERIEALISQLPQA